MTSIDLYVDPICPFAWATSRWLLDAAGATGHEVTLRQMSLAVLNEGRDMPPPQRAKLDWSRRVGRVFAAATAESGPGAFADLYVAFGPLVHTADADPGDSSIKEALAATSCSPALLDALEDPAWDDLVRVAHQASQDVLGGSGGSPIIAVGGRGYFGPVLMELPARDAGITLLDAVLTAVSMPGFAGLHRPYQGPPSVPQAGGR
ncbi:disulfide bond formation protein DsbA [Mycobacterium sp.]|uniref:mycothiol-dependent nitroreductase Rv2466c family protein n=1 Tax=Mycobacterium sp. TaxID=1785 RepID=UPI0012799233|nr:disulfide bond formation protein DsbA [Mycobacterium sp.]KAA8968800.1 MAG: DsbA family protein [Mycobacterium sp.]